MPHSAEEAQRLNTLQTTAPMPRLMTKLTVSDPEGLTGPIHGSLSCCDSCCIFSRMGTAEKGAAVAAVASVGF